MGKFSDKVFGANVDQKTKDIFNALQRGQYEFSPGESVTDLPEHSRYLGEKTTFARMWVALQATGSDVKNDIFYYSVNDNKFNSYEPNQSINGESYFVEGTENPFLKPNAGITSISSKTEGALGAVRRTTVEFVVHNKQDFDEIYLPFFLRPGATVVVDYGWSDKNMELYDIESQLSNTDTELKDFKKFIYNGGESGPNSEQIFTNSEGGRYYYSIADDGEVASVTDKTNTTPPGWVYKHKGLVDTNVGVVTSYNSKVTQNGSFECSIELVSENATILDNEVSSDNNLKFIFANKIEDILIEAIVGEKIQDKAKEYDMLSVDEKKTSLNLFFTGLAGSETLGVIPQVALNTGVYYEQKVPSNQESLYITFGVLTDLFLNNFVCKSLSPDKYQINFKLDDYFVRWDSNLYRRQTTLLGTHEELPVFLYPKNWKKTKDTIKNKNRYKTVGDFKQQKSGDNPYKTPVIPLREVFINVSVIKSAFQKKHNVNDVINSILQSVNDDSYGVFDLKMISPNRSYSEIGFQDNNLINPLANEDSILKFDVTSGNGIVSNMDYSFETPKGGLQNMLAIGNKTDQSIFDVDNLDNLNFLRVLKPSKTEGKTDAFIRSLPIIPVVDPTEEDKISTFDVDVKVPTDYFEDVRENNFNTVNGSWKSFIKDVETLKDIQGTKPKKVEEVEDLSEEEKDKIKTLSASSDRDFWGKSARLVNILKSEENTISPILPINLTLSVYGNTHLNIGDIFTINFLPKTYSRYVYFQIVGVEHKISSNWETTYQTVFRIRPSEKKVVVGKTKGEDSIPKVKYDKKDYSNYFTGVSNAVVDSVVDLKVLDSISTNHFKEVKRVESNFKKYKNATECIDQFKNISNILDITLSPSQVNTLNHVRMALAWTQTIYEWTKDVVEGKKVKYILRDFPGNNRSSGFLDEPKDLVKELDDFDIFIDIDYWGKAGHTLKHVYRDPQNTDGVQVYIPLAGNVGTADDQKLCEQMLQAEAKRAWAKSLLNKMGEAGTRRAGDIVGNISQSGLDKSYAPIFSRVRFKIGDLNKDERVSWYFAEIIAPSTEYIDSFIPRIKIPDWVVGYDDNDSAADINKFIERYFTNFNGIKIPEN